MNISPLKTAILALASSMDGLSSSMSKTPSHKANPKDLKKTKKGAKHVVGSHFKPKYLIFVDGKHVTPAMYRRLHLGVKNPRKSNGPKHIN